MELDLRDPMIGHYKARAKELRQDRTWNGDATSHAQALELVAREHGARDWNTLRARAAKPTRLAPGMRVTGRYLGHAFDGQVLGAQIMGQGERLRVVLHLDDPVDVVTSERFSSFRQRITAVIGRDGRSRAHTSDGTPHLALVSVQG